MSPGLEKEKVVEFMFTLRETFKNIGIGNCSLSRTIIAQKRTPRIERWNCINL
jgi:hypothetical protein